jgi:ribosomal protein L11 methyltransferase
MPTDYIQVTATPLDAEWQQIIIAELSMHGYDVFEEAATHLTTYIAYEQFDPKILIDISTRYNDLSEFEFEIAGVAKQNWNALWESNYTPVLIDDFCAIRAPFHAEQPDFLHQLVIEPKMSFGTGHHQTTESVIKLMRPLHFDNKTVMDMGSGTGILGILACKMGAKSCFGIDNEAWAVENSLENAQRNHTPNFTAVLGSVEHIRHQTFDITLANINKNIILNDLRHYAHATHQYLILSGFLTTDIPDIVAACADYHFTKINQETKGEWAALLFEKPDYAIVF